MARASRASKRKRISTATTARMSSRRPRVLPHHFLLPDQVVTSPESGVRYRVDRILGEGGFGQVYLASRVGARKTAPPVCIKVSPHQDGWLREAHFGQVLHGNPRAISVHDTFPLPLPDGRMLYCLALEYARHGDLGAYLQRTGKGWPEAKARREIAGILGVLGELHRGDTLHRDLTPMNVFVCDGVQLKLGDFGIARRQSDRRGVAARTMNRHMAPSDRRKGAAPKWQARDDVYQVGQLLGMLIRGDASRRLRTPEIRKLDCGDHLKEILHRCLGERRKRYESADELIDALRHPPAPLRTGRLRTLKGVHLAFTGILSVSRAEAAKAARKAGAVVHGGPSTRTTAVVRGKPNAQQAAGRDAGLKLMEIKRLRAKGHRIVLVSEAQFWKLVGGRPAGRPRRRR